VILIDWFVPAFKAGGPIRTIFNLVSQLKDHFEISIITGDRDLNEKEPLPGIPLDKWSLFEENINIYYISQHSLSFNKIRELINEKSPDVVYCNGMYSRFFTVYPMIMKAMGFFRGKLIVGPHGMLKPSALQFKATKKKVFLKLIKLTGAVQKCHFHATDDDEVEDIRSQFGNVSISTVMDMPARINIAGGALLKKELTLRAIFIGRIHPIKNLEFALRVLRSAKGEIELSISGTIEDTEYWERCKSIISDLPSNIKVRYLGELNHKEVIKELRDSHILILPTKGENFGHAIYEALSEGKPVIISDQTPWKNLEKVKAGFDLSLDRQDLFEKAIDSAVLWGQNEYSLWSSQTRIYLKTKVDHDKIIKDYVKLFE
jgi:glycosyltransferase involved in cell wall biosynthesis